MISVKKKKKKKDDGRIYIHTYRRRKLINKTKTRIRQQITKLKIRKKRGKKDDQHARSMISKRGPKQAERQAESPPERESDGVGGCKWVSYETDDS